MAAHARLKNAFTEDEKCHNLTSWLISDVIRLSEVGVGKMTTNSLFMNEKKQNFQVSSLLCPFTIIRNFDQLFMTIIKL